MSKKRNLGRLRTSPDALQRVPASRLIILRPPHEDAVGTRTIISRTLTVAVRKPPLYFEERHRTATVTARLVRSVCKEPYGQYRLAEVVKYGGRICSSPVGFDVLRSLRPRL